MDTYYVGAYGVVPVAVDTNKENVEHYLKKIRMLKRSDYSLRSQQMTPGVAYATFERELMQDFDNGLILPTRDCDYLGDRLDGHYREIEQTVKFLSSMAGIASVSEFRNDVAIYRNTIDLLLRTIDKKKRRQIYEDAVLFDSPIFKMGIQEYLAFIKQDKENERQRARYLMSISDDIATTDPRFGIRGI